jgi:hypothetical protein
MNSERLAISATDIVELAEKIRHSRNVERILHYYGNDWRNVASRDTVMSLWWLWNRWDRN